MLKSFSSTLSTSSITGTLGVPNGGTGLTILASGYIPYGNGTNAFNSSNKFTFNGINFVVGLTAPYTSGTDIGTFAYSQAALSQVVIDNQNASGSAGLALSASGGFWGIQVPASGTFVNPLQFKFGSSEKMRISASGGVSIGNTTDPGAGNLRFNTRNTNGILFGTSSTSVLSDYEEGTWTPNQGAGLTVVGTFSSAGTYTKIGRVVTITFFVNGSTSISLAGGSALVCSNMPYAAAITSGSAFFGTGANGYNTAAANVQFYQNAVYSVQSLTGTGGIYVSGTFNI